MGPGDLGRVVLYDRRGREQSTWTASKEELFRGARQGGARRRRDVAARGGAAGNPRGIDQTRDQRTRAAYARSYAEEERAAVENLLRDVSAELTLTALPGKRAFVFVSGGFDAQPGYAMYEYALGRFNMGLSAFDARSTANVIDALVKKANASEVTFYTVDARGLTAEGGNVGDDDPLLSRPGVSFTARQDSQAGLLSLANETGGIALLNTNALARGLERIYQDASTYYSVGVTLTNLPGSGFRSVRVSVTRPGVVVRARRSFAPRTPSDRASDVAQSALRSNVQYRGIPVSLSIAPPARQQEVFLGARRRHDAGLEPDVPSRREGPPGQCRDLLRRHG